MLVPDVASWSAWVWVLHALGLLYVGGFVFHYVRFARLEARALAGDPAAVERFNAALKGFPANMYAKMCGKRSLEDGPDDPAAGPH